MFRYCLDRLPSADGEHIIHKTDSDCPLLPPPQHRIDLGEQLTCHTALIMAATHFEIVNGCYYCAGASHIRQILQEKFWASHSESPARP